MRNYRSFDVRILRGRLPIILPLVMMACLSGGRQDAAEPVCVMTYNIRFANKQDGPDFWDSRRDRVGQELSTAEVVGLQEVLESQLNDLKERMPQFQWYGVGREDGQSKGEFCPIGYRADRFECVDQGTFWLSPTPEVAGSKGWDAALPRIASWVRLKRTGDKEDARLLVVNTHFDHIGQQARVESAGLLAKRAAELAGNDPAVITGDFNVKPDHAAYKKMVEKPTWRDAREITAAPPAGPSGTWNGFTKIIEGQRIDHIFVTSQVAVERYEVRDPKTEANRFASDHLPVVVWLKL